MPTLLILVGLIGGLAGRLIFPPAPSLPTFGRLDSRVVVRVERPPVRIGWIQLIVGIGVAIAGTMYADKVRNGLAYVLAGQGNSFGARPLVTWQISALAALVGGAIAGWASRGGTRQIVLAGIGAGAGVVPILSAMASTNPSAIIDFWIQQFDLKAANWTVFVAIGASTTVATILGAWFGAHLKPGTEQKQNGPRRS